MNRRDFLRRTSALTAVAAVAPAALLDVVDRPEPVATGYTMQAIHLTDAGNAKMSYYEDLVAMTAPRSHIYHVSSGELIGWDDVRGPGYARLIANRGAEPTVVSLHKL